MAFLIPPPKDERELTWILYLKTALLSLSLLTLVGILDHLTGTELYFSAFYFIPVVVAGWYLRYKGALYSSLAAAVVWAVVTWYDRPDVKLFPLIFLNALIQFIVFAAMGYAWAIVHLALERTRKARDMDEDINRELAEAYRKLAESTAEVNKLRGQYVTICAWTRKIKDKGQWVTFEQFLEGNFGVEITHGMSPESMAEIQKSLGEQPRPK